ncbi:ATP-dependent endonuclease [Glaciibacter superstes]|uniref:ATP-dependent endonuclease n=1 Tax=Glaciibacter superstes TaxID=501023 RepID=UPI0004257CAF|nr:ATP-dependent endonuclease [Glaciibacter superstes]
MTERVVTARHEGMERFRAAVTAWAADGEGAAAAEAAARTLPADLGLRTAVLVEGASDRVAVEALAVRLGRDLAAEGVCVVPIGGAMSIGRFLALFSPDRLDVLVAGLCDVGEARYFGSALERAGFGADITQEQMERLGFFVCHADLEDELIRSLGFEGVERIVEQEGDLGLFRTFQRQPAQRERATEQQLRRFMGTIKGRKIHYAQALVDGVDLSRVPRPLERLLAQL